MWAWLLYKKKKKKRERDGEEWCSGLLTFVMEKVLIVGAGATGSLAASILASKAQNISLTVWDKGGGGGGRMTTRRNMSEHQIDLGAQYITRFCKDGYNSREEQLKDKIFDELVSNKVLVPFTGAIEGDTNDSSNVNYVCPSGMNGVPKYFLQQSKANCIFRRQLKSVDVNSATNQISCGWSQDDSQGKETFDGLILTLPVPQLLGLEGNIIESLQKQEVDNLKTVEYSSRYAMGIGFDSPVPSSSWTGRYFKHPIIRYASWDNLKRGQPTNKPSLLIHTSVPFGLKHLEEDKAAVSSMITAALPEVIPGLPTPSFSYIIRWRYSQVFKPYPGTPGCAVLHVNPLVVATGDAFTHSNLEGCISAASSTAETLMNRFK